MLNNFLFIPRKTNTRIIRHSRAFIILGLKDNELNISDDLSIRKIIVKRIINPSYTTSDVLT